MNILKTLLFLGLVFNFGNIFSQRQANIWHFGNNAGIDFNSGEAIPFSNSSLRSFEGCASISDSLGNLLFYTNGVTVWNKENSIMQNGNFLKGDTSSTQSAIIIPHPADDKIFYIFTVDTIMDNGDFNTTDGLNYSIVNMNLDNGKGAISSKNLPLHDWVSEKITAIKRKADNSVWVLAHEWNSNKFLAWKIDANGLNITPIISATGSVHHQIETNFMLNSIGQMKFNSAGDKVAVIQLRSSLLEIFDFDITTGTVSNPLNISLFARSFYGVEFSLDNTKIYFSVGRDLYSADLSSYNETDVNNSVTQIYSGTNYIGSLQMAPDERIYTAVKASDYLGVVNNPNEIAGNCNFEINGFYLDGKESRLGLPNFIQNYFFQSTFDYRYKCFGSETEFFLIDESIADSVLWNFGETISGANNFSKDMISHHTYLQAGVFTVSVKVWKSGVEYNFFENIEILQVPKINLGNDTIICGENSYKLDAYAEHRTYLWNTFSTDSIITVNSDGLYDVTVKNTYTNCENSDTIFVDFADLPEIFLGNDTIICENAEIRIDAYNQDFTEYLWQDNSELSYFIADTIGEYFVSVKNTKGCINSDTLNLNFKYLPRFSFPSDTTICEDGFIELSPKINNYTEIIWSDNSDNETLSVYSAGKYFLQTKNECGTWSDTISINFEYCGEIYIPNIFTPQDDGINDIFKIRGIEKGSWNLIIFSRWGDKVYESANYENDWSAENVVSGVYFYILSNNNSNETYKGHVRVVK